MSVNESEIKWYWKSSKNPWSSEDSEQWTLYTPLIARKIEEAYQNHYDEIILNEKYKIDLNLFIQLTINDIHQQRPIRRCSMSESMIEVYRRQRFNFTQPIKCSITNDTFYYGIPFITDWLIIFTNGTLKVHLQNLIDALINGIKFEGEQLNYHEETQCLMKEIQSIEKKTMLNLQKCCARLYSKPCFLFKIVNETLGSSNHEKLHTIGPFCYLLYNYIGIKHNKYPSIRKRISQLFKLNKPCSSILVYRGENLPNDQIEFYKKAVGKGFIYKWSSFISTSKSRDVGTMYSGNILYIIEIQRIPSNDQYVDISSIAYIPDEEEILLKPGVRLKFNHYEYDVESKQHIFHVQIVPSYISNII